ncbi:LegC family aminotransferase [[Clostridium] innocuum]|nr:LegC family aminotransferase [[Clostridium] innocuum]
MDKYIPLCIPNFEGNERKYVDDALDQGWVSTGGAYINKLEKDMAEYLAIKDVAACQSGTAALHLSLIESGVQPQDMVIVPTLTFIAAVNPVMYRFAEPVFMDCDDNLCIDPDKLRQFCDEECEYINYKLIHKESKKHIKALIVVHVFGNLADMDNIMEIADIYNLKVIEDATEALGSKFTEGKYAGKYAGTIADFGAYSFNGNKIITTGGGGAVTASSKKSVEHMRYLSTQSKDDPHYYIHNEIGYNYRMTNIQAALGVAQMEKLPEFVYRKQRIHSLYKKLFSDFELGSIMDFRVDILSNCWFNSLIINRNKIKADMRTIITSLEKHKIGTRAVWELIHQQVPYRNALAYKINKANYYSSCILNLPSSTNLIEEDIVYVVNVTKNVLRGLKDA